MVLYPMARFLLSRPLPQIPFGVTRQRRLGVPVLESRRDTLYAEFLSSSRNKFVEPSLKSRISNALSVKRSVSGG